MDKLGERKGRTSRGKGEFISQIKESLGTLRQELTGGGRALMQDLLIFAVGFLLSRCQIILGARPAGLAYISLLQGGIWPALMGTVVGSLSLGLDGIIFAAATLVIALLRAAASSGEKKSGGRTPLFGESLILRISVAVLGGFVVALYEVLMQGINEATVIFGLVMIILTPVLTFALSGLFSTGVDFDGLMNGSADVLRLSGLERNERYNRIFFQISALTLIFLISLSVKDINIFGISLSYIFSGVITLLVAKRFGAIRAMGVGFISSLGVSGVLSVAFALAGLCSGVLFGFGTGYAIVGGGVALCVWSAYSSGLSGLLSTLPEYTIATAVAMPLLKKVGEKPTEEDTPDKPEGAEDMVGTMALSYQNRFSGSLDSLESALSDISRIIGEYSTTDISLTREEYIDIILRAAEKGCSECDGDEMCKENDIRPTEKNAESLAKLLLEGKKITPDDLNTSTEFCQMAEQIAERINREAGRREQEKYFMAESAGSAEEYELIAKLISQARVSDDAERQVDNSMTAVLTQAFEDCGFKNGLIRAFGNRRKHFILAGEDESGARISSFELRKSIEAAAGVRLGTPEYFRRGKMVLMECGIRRTLKVSVASATLPGKDGEISGDTVATFESDNDFFYSLISDGMGSGELAKRTSEFVGEYIKGAMKLSSAKETLLHILNHAIRARGDECSATVDLFELDLLNGGGMFLKSGAAPSYIKRESSIFRIRSQTTPIGLLRSIDTEKISVEIKPGDHIIMMSDGVADVTEDAPWLLLLLGEPVKKNLKEYAEYIISEAQKNSHTGDDISVTVIRVEET